MNAKFNWHYISVWSIENLEPGIGECFMLYSLMLN